MSAESVFRLVETDIAARNRLMEDAKLDGLTATLLVNRGVIDAAQAEDFLDPRLARLPPVDGMAGLNEAVDRLIHARAHNEEVVIYGDYDVDGMTSTAVLSRFADGIGLRTRPYIPHRVEEGYGMNLEAIEGLCDQGAKLIVAVDNGTASTREIARANERGCDVIVVDHHTVPPEMPPARALINPRRADCRYPDKNPAAVGLTWLLCAALRAELDRRGILPRAQCPDPRKLLDLVALGTIADMVPLQGVNRRLAAHGLGTLATTGKAGLIALKSVAQTAAIPTSFDVAFKLGPRLNAAGRMESAMMGVRLLTTEDMDEAESLARDLDQLNQARRDEERRTLADAIAWIEQHPALLDEPALVLWSRRWNPGVIGIVASRLLERFHKPTFLVAVDPDPGPDGRRIGKGSGRGIEGGHLVDALRECGDLLVKYGGHVMAAGLTIIEGDLPDFEKRFRAACAKQLRPEQYRKAVRVDGKLTPSRLNVEKITALQRLAPFGQGNPDPVFLAQGVRVVDTRTVGEGHLRLEVHDGYGSHTVIAFRMAEKRPQVGDRIDLAYTPEVDSFRGLERIQLRTRHFEPTC